MGDPAGPSQDTAPKTILIIEHDEPTADMYVRILQIAGFAVRRVLSAPDALRDVAAHPPDAILVDFRMPVMDGLEFLRALRAKPRHRVTPVAIVTGDYQLDERLVSQIRDLGAVIRFKPLWVDELTALAKQLIAGTAREN
jgi:CheY-like chemotaxis protein